MFTLRELVIDEHDDIDKPHDECGVFAISNNGDTSVDVAIETYFGLYALQHRGQESCGIAVNDSGVIEVHKDVGLVPEVFTKDVLKKLPKGQMAVGHVRYSTMGEASALNAQPMVVKHAKGTLALAHNGNLINAAELRAEMQNDGIIFHTTNDTEVIAYTIAKERLSSKSIEEAIERSMSKIRGSYSMVIMSPQKLIAARDPQGFRPLVIGKLKDSYIFASETCALDAVSATFVRDVLPGEICEISDGVLSVYKQGLPRGTGFCVFEFVYTARPDSTLEGASVHESRKRAGAFLAKSHPVEADVVCGVPDSGLDSAMGYSEASGIPYGIGLLRNRYIGRTFIQPLQTQRENSVKIKLNPISSTIKGKRVVLVDDSIVRGTTCGRIVKLLREAGAKEVHMRISSPPFVNPCYFGTDIANRQDLIACRMPIEDIATHIGADSIGFLDIEDAKRIAKGATCDFCVGCFTGKYPIDVPDEISKDKFEQKLS